MDPVNGWRKFANPTTFVDWFLVSEIVKNAKHTYHGTSFANKVCHLIMHVTFLQGTVSVFGLAFPIF